MNAGGGPANVGPRASKFKVGGAIVIDMRFFNAIFTHIFSRGN